MNRTMSGTLAATLALALFPSTGLAQGRDITLHVNPRWSECSFQIDPSLTQEAWHQFTTEAGVVTYFRPLTDARPMGVGNFEISVVRYETAIDDADPAWNDTFVHPDATHWLFDGSRLPFPGVTARAGVTERIDLGAYFAKNPNANYGFYGAQAQYNVIQPATADWAASTRLSFVSLFGPEDLDFTVFGLDLVASREFVASGWASFSPYAGVSTYLARAHETTAAVSLRDEDVLGAQATIGVVASLSVVRLAAEYSTARVQARAFKVGIGF